MSKKIDFEKLHVGAKKQVQKTEILPEEKLDEALKTIHETKEEPVNERAKPEKKSKKLQKNEELKKDPKQATVWVKRSCIDVPRDLYLRLKTRSLDEQKPMYQFILDCVESYLEQTEAIEDHEPKK